MALALVIFFVSFAVCAGFLGMIFLSSTELRLLRDSMLMSEEQRAGKAQANAIAATAKPQVKLVKTARPAPEPEPEPEPEPDDTPEEEDEAAPEASGEIMRQAKVVIMKFLEGSLAGVMKNGFKLDGLTKFGCHLFLAGASEALGRANNLGQQDFVKVLETSVAVLGSGPDVAQKFAEKYDEYLMVPEYTALFRAGADAMGKFTRGEKDIGASMTAALEEFRSPKDAKKKGPIAVLFTDIVGSTKLTQTLGDAGAQKLVHLHNTVVRNALREYSGTEIKHTGDGIMASFGSVPNAVEAGIALQKALAGHRAQDPTNPLHLRVGINAGEPIAEGGDLFGTTVQLAARICDKAPTDGVMVSSIVRELCSGRPLKFDNKGTFELKGISEPATLHSVTGT